MKKDYGQTAEALLNAMGGKKNVKQVFHCMTRLRFYLKDKSAVREPEILRLKEVSGTNWHQDQFQVIVGNEVDAVYHALVEKGAPSEDDTGSEGSREKKDVFSVIVDSITGCMTPMIPALTSAGMIKVVLTLLTTFHIMPETSSTYQVLNLIGDVAFYFMPFLIAANAAKVFKVNQALALIIAGTFLHPNFVAMTSAASSITFIGLPVTKAVYAYSVIPVILMVWIMSYIEKLVDRVTPRITKLILNPTLVTLISAPIALIVIGPLGAIIGNGLAVALGFLSAKLGFVIVGILAAAFPFIVMTGMHHALTPIGLNAMASGGTDGLIFVSQICSNLAQSGASLAVAVKTKNKDMKQLAGASGISALMGITEPALYGVNLKLKRPVAAAAVAAGMGGIIGGILQVSLYIPQNCIMAIPAFIGEKGMSNLVYGLIMMAVSFAASFILTIVLGFEDIKEDKEGDSDDMGKANETAETAPKEPEKEPGKVQTGKPLVERLEIYSPLTGMVKALEHVPDKTFSDKILGDGIAVVPSSGRVTAPADGRIETIMETKHGIAFVTDSGVQLLIHVGLDTVNLNGRYFTAHVKNQDHVKAGDLLLEFDLEAMIAEGYNMITPVIVANTQDYIRAVPMVKDGMTVNAGQRLLTIV